MGFAIPQSTLLLLLLLRGQCTILVVGGDVSGETYEALEGTGDGKGKGKGERGQGKGEMGAGGVLDGLGLTIVLLAVDQEIYGQNSCGWQRRA